MKPRMDTDGDPLPVVPITELAGRDPQQAAAWISENAAAVSELLANRGGILFRAAPVSSADEFQRFCCAYTPNFASYVGGGSPRTRIGGAVYTSTEYASGVSIPLHCEASYMPTMPTRIWFYCHVPPEHGGRTPIGDMRRVAARLDPALLQRFRDKGLLYVMNMSAGQGFGKSWRQTYETNDPEEAERLVRAQGHHCEWTADGTLRVLMRQAAERPHPVTGEPIWVNQAVNWHPAHLGMERFQALLRMYGDQINFPKSVLFGDGSEIDPEDIFAIQAALAAEEVSFGWQRGDVLLLDNYLMAHGRQAFRGERAIYVALA